MPTAEHQRASRVSGGAGTSMVSRVAERMAQRPFDLEEWRARSRGWGELRARVGGAIGGVGPFPTSPRGRTGRSKALPSVPDGRHQVASTDHQQEQTHETEQDSKVDADLGIGGTLRQGRTGCGWWSGLRDAALSNRRIGQVLRLVGFSTTLDRDERGISRRIALRPEHLVEFPTSRKIERNLG